MFSALKILRSREPEIGDTHVAADIGCSTFSTQAPFNVGNSVLGYGMGLASSSAVSPLFGKRTISVMGDGGFWHNGLHQRRRERDVQPPGLGAGDPRQLLRGGDRPAPRALDRQERAQRAAADDDPDALRGVGVKWIRTVNSYRIAEVIGTMREALTTRVQG